VSIPMEKLLVLKAYYLGHAIGKKKVIIAPALDMVNAAIDYLSNKSDQSSRVRHLFYLLLKAEILRDNSESHKCREEAMLVSYGVDGNPYKLFMAIEDATQTQSKVHGIQQGLIGDEGVKHRKEFVYIDGLGRPRVGSYDAALRAVGVDESDVNDKERHFLHKTNLKELLDKHDVPFSL